MSIWNYILLLSLCDAHTVAAYMGQKVKMKKEESNMKKKPWPTKKAMEQVYKNKLWGGNNTDFYSGTGSHDLEVVQPYIAAVSSFLSSFENPLVVCDLGCGDFNVGKQLVPYVEKYVAVDIVEALITRNKNTFKAEPVTFLCLDIAEDQLPVGDCAILRQVLQHLSNTEIQYVLKKLSDYKYIILTEHLPVGDFIPNKDIISGQGIRLKKHSGVNLLAAPFHFKVKNEKPLLSIALKDGKGMIVTTLYEI